MGQVGGFWWFLSKWWAVAVAVGCGATTNGMLLACVLPAGDPSITWGTATLLAASAGGWAMSHLEEEAQAREDLRIARLGAEGWLWAKIETVRRRDGVPMIEAARYVINGAYEDNIKRLMES